MTTKEQDEKTPDFEALRSERNRRDLARWKKFAEKYGYDTDEVLSGLRPDRCYCDCENSGPCEHRWDGAGIAIDNGLGWSATCSRCGGTAMSHSMRVGP